MKTTLSIVLRVIALTTILFICFTVAGRVIGQQDTSPAPAQTGVAVALLAVCFLNTIVLTHIILWSRWAGGRVIATVFYVFYGVMTFMSQMESAVFDVLGSAGYWSFG
jgi:surface polysaccharide O-acyltransferase-like enzyme